MIERPRPQPVTPRSKLRNVTTSGQKRRLLNGLDVQSQSIPDRASAFMLGIMPEELREKGKAAADLAIKRSSAEASIREKADEYNKRQESTPVVAATEVQAPIVPTNADIEAYLASQKGNVTQGSHLL